MMDSPDSRSPDDFVGQLGELAERIIYRREQSVGSLRDVLAADANLLDDVAEALTASDQRVKAIQEELRELWHAIENLRGYRVAEQGPFLAHIDSILDRLRSILRGDSDD